MAFLDESIKIMTENGSEILSSARFKDISLIGEGVSSTVYKAIDRKTDSTVVIKVLNPHLNTDEISIERFKREIQITRHIGHPKIVSIYELFDTEGHLSLIMEYIDGLSLKEYVKLSHPVKIEVILSILRQLIDILTACHSRDVIHRDLKSQNIMIDKDGHVKLLDFGIARMTSLSDLTKTGTSIGTPEYMAPELFATNTYDPRTDIYALGIILFELLTGRLPFQGDSIAILFHQHLHSPVPDMAEYRKDAPEWLQDVIRKMLAKQPGERYQSVNEILFDVENEKVISKSLPKLPKTNCLNCSKETIEEFPICIHCGFNYFDIFHSGKFSLVCNDEKGRQKLPDFFKQILKIKIPLPKRNQNRLISKIDRFSAEILKKSALKHQIHLQIEKNSISQFLGNIGFGLLSGYLMFEMVLAFLELVLRLSLPLFRPNDMRFLGLSITWHSFLTQIFMISLLGYFSFASSRALFKRIRPPLIKDAKDIQKRLNQAHAWIKSLAGELKKERSEEMNQALSLFFEKYLILANFSKDLNQELKDKMQGLVKTIVSLANLIEEMNASLSKMNIINLTYQYYPNSDNQINHALKEQICEYNRIEEKYSQIMNRFIYLQFLFNLLAGKSLVLNASPSDLEVGNLFGCVKELEKELQVARETSHEIKRAL
ncbi:MAG: serine/threonine protein kinase [bacterium]